MSREPVGIRVWNGCEVVAMVVVSSGGSVFLGAVGGAENSTPIEIEIDPWAGLIVDRRAGTGPRYYAKDDQ